MIKIIFRLILLSSVVVSLSACVTYPINTELQGSTVLNFDAHYQSLPVVVHLYQLTDNNQFVNASFYELWKHPESTLGNTLVSHQSITLNPGEKKTLKTNRKRGANFIAAIAIFRKPHSRQWKVYKQLPRAVPYIPTRILLGLTGNRIYIK